MLIAGSILVVVAQVPPQKLMVFAVPLYAAGVALLVAVALFGITKKGAQRWINLGIVIQPSEIPQIAMPPMLAWWVPNRGGRRGRAVLFRGPGGQTRRGVAPAACPWWPTRGGAGWTRSGWCAGPRDALPQGCARWRPARKPPASR